MVRVAPCAAGLAAICGALRARENKFSCCWSASSCFCSASCFSFIFFCEAAIFAAMSTIVSGGHTCGGYSASAQQITQKRRVANNTEATSISLQLAEIKQGAPLSVLYYPDRSDRSHLRRVGCVPSRPTFSTRLTAQDSRRAPGTGQDQDTAVYQRSGSRGPANHKAKVRACTPGTSVGPVAMGGKAPRSQPT